MTFPDDGALLNYSSLGCVVSFQKFCQDLGQKFCTQISSLITVYGRQPSSLILVQKIAGGHSPFCLVCISQHLWHAICRYVEVAKQLIAITVPLTVNMVYGLIHLSPDDHHLSVCQPG
jgi:hypothetical protein